jgi:hypothetical protein
MPFHLKDREVAQAAPNLNLACLDLMHQAEHRNCVGKPIGDISPIRRRPKGDAFRILANLYPGGDLKSFCVDH